MPRLLIGKWSKLLSVLPPDHQPNIGCSDKLDLPTRFPLFESFCGISDNGARDGIQSPVSPKFNYTLEKDMTQ